jgi:hypothetical protein
MRARPVSGGNRPADLVAKRAVDTLHRSARHASQVHLCKAGVEVSPSARSRDTIRDAKRRWLYGQESSAGSPARLVPPGVGWKIQEGGLS